VIQCKLPETFFSSSIHLAWKQQDINNGDQFEKMSIASSDYYLIPYNVILMSVGSLSGNIEL
jgi:hypothetical protein